MATDNDPVDYLYISRRLVSDIVSQHTARQRRWGFSARLPIPIVRAEIAIAPSTVANIYSDVGRATMAVSDQSGTVEVPGRHFVRDHFDIEWAVLEGVPEDKRQSVFATFIARSTSGVRVILVGSASNLDLGGALPPGSTYGYDGSSRRPSLTRMLSNRSKARAIDAGRTAVAMRDESFVRAVVEFVDTGFKMFASGAPGWICEPTRARVEVLAKLFTGPVSFAGAPLIVAAPIWIRTPAPTDLALES